jgi:hypothetical protein
MFAVPVFNHKLLQYIRYHVYYPVLLQRLNENKDCLS